MCISRLLTVVEGRYSQIEKEALAIVWAIKRLKLILLGQKFELHIDNKAFQLILKNPLSKPPFEYEVVHIPGRGNKVDFLSRHPMAVKREDLDDINALVN